MTGRLSVGVRFQEIARQALCDETEVPPDGSDDHGTVDANQKLIKEKDEQ